MTLLEVENLQTHFRTREGVNRAVDGVSLTLAQSETLAIVGESGCGKTVLTQSILRLVPQPPARIAGRIRFRGRDILALSKTALRDIRGREIGMIFQEASASLNPALTIGRQVGDTLRRHEGLRGPALQRRVHDLLARVGIAEPARVARDYPHRLSGGMQQRVMIASAIACNPQILIADEPTTALDVTIQAQILALLGQLKRDTGMAMMLITHDLGVAAETADRVLVMYAGRKVEEAPVRDLFHNPRHPYTQGLFKAAAKLGAAGDRKRLAEIPGNVPVLNTRVAGCVFAERCAFTTDLCRSTPPALDEKAPRHFAACHYAPREKVPA